MSYHDFSRIRKLEDDLKAATPKKSARLTRKLVRLKEKFFDQ